VGEVSGESPIWSAGRSTAVLVCWEDCPVERALTFLQNMRVTESWMRASGLNVSASSPLRRSKPLVLPVVDFNSLVLLWRMEHSRKPVVKKPRN